MEINLVREAALPDVTATLKEPGFFARTRVLRKNQGSSQEPGGTCVCERNQPRDAACRYRTDPLTTAFAGLDLR